MISLPADLLAQITKAAEDAYPNECCGLLSGSGNAEDGLTISGVHPSANVAEQGIRDRFEVDPKVRFDLMRELDGTSEHMIGHYHSHPGQAAEPSQHDLEMAFEPELVWLITAVGDDGHAGETRAWRLDRESRSVESVALEVEDD